MYHHHLKEAVARFECVNMSPLWPGGLEACVLEIQLEEPEGNRR
jgi:hypothetical protein